MSKEKILMNDLSFGPRSGVLSSISRQKDTRSPRVDFLHVAGETFILLWVNIGPTAWKRH